MDLQSEKQVLLNKITVIDSIRGEVISKLNGSKGVIVAKPKKKPKKVSIKPTTRRTPLSSRRTLKAGSGCGGCNRGK